MSLRYATFEFLTLGGAMEHNHLVRSRLSSRRRASNESNAGVSRRIFIAAVLATGFVPATIQRHAFAGDAKPTLIYLSAWDCPVCREWERGDLPEFNGSAESRVVKSREVAVHSLSNIREKSMWPADLEWLRVQVPREGTPRFFIVRGHKILVKAAGIDGWENTIEPWLKKLAASG